MARSIAKNLNFIAVSKPAECMKNWKFNIRAYNFLLLYLFFYFLNSNRHKSNSDIIVSVVLNEMETSFEFTKIILKGINVIYTYISANFITRLIVEFHVKCIVNNVNQNVIIYLDLLQVFVIDNNPELSIELLSNL